MKEKTGKIPSKIEEALSTILKDHPKEGEVVYSYIEDLRKQNITVLGDNELLNITDNDGEIRAFKRLTYLSGKDGTLIQPVPGGPYVISAQGYEKINQDTGTIVMNADYVLVDGLKQQNPHISRDKNNGRILSIYSRAIAFRYSPLGVPQVSDRTTIFDVPAYRLIDLLAKAKKFPQAFRLLPNEMAPDHDEGGTWAQYKFDENTSLWIDTSHDEALQFYSQIINREKKAIDFAQTFAQRNAAKHLHGVQKAPGIEWKLPVICWRPMNDSPLRWDGAKYIATQKLLTGMADGKQSDFEIIDGVDYVSDDAVLVEAEDALEEGKSEESEDPEPKEKKEESENPEPKKEREDPGNKIWAQYDATPEEFIKKAMSDLKIGTVTTAMDAKKVLKKAMEIADKGE